MVSVTLEGPQTAQVNGAAQPTTASTQLRGAASLSRGACPQQGHQLLSFQTKTKAGVTKQKTMEAPWTGLAWPGLQPQQLHKVMFMQPGLTRDCRSDKSAARKEIHSNLIQNFLFSLANLSSHIFYLQAQKSRNPKTSGKKSFNVFYCKYHLVLRNKLDRSKSGSLGMPCLSRGSRPE